MNLTERIAQLEAEHQRCIQQVQYWTQTQLRTEGALLILKQMKDEDERVNTNDAAVSGSGSGAGSESIQADDVC